MLSPENFYRKNVALPENIGVFNDDGNVIDGVVITFIDISVAKKLEAELRAAKGAGL